MSFKYSEQVYKGYFLVIDNGVWMIWHPDHKGEPLRPDALKHSRH